jgi:hypothetical protein
MGEEGCVNQSKSAIYTNAENDMIIPNHSWLPLRFLRVHNFTPCKCLLSDNMVGEY